jgi:hypothetical protein
VPREVANGVESREARDIGVDVRGQARIAVAHQFLREALRDTGDGELGREGIPQ